MKIGTGVWFDTVGQLTAALAVYPVDTPVRIVTYGDVEYDEHNEIVRIESGIPYDGVAVAPDGSGGAVILVDFAVGVEMEL